ncbi:response regulator transcription factor [Dyadobacter sp. CY261]|uniref:response regulator n=1 Tax=Dyadobacter sp. CY261 TaxID=2907203 RepID=UPI001F16F332|nr:response regulator transcription factor [Dyadobacter sp. CY261]MCF0072754.1 response regulator transcription factor [Dyadobacter sp. CY261]
MKHVLIVEDHPVVSIGIALVARDVVGECDIVQTRTFPDAIDVLTTKEIDLIILDVKVPGGGGAKMIPKLRSIQKNVGILISSGLSEKHHAMTFLKEGADGYVSKNAGDSEFREALRKVLGGKRYLSDALQEMLVQSLLASNELVIPFTDSLTPRELEVMNLLIEGKQNTEISRRLRLKLSTVSAHKKRIMQKVGANNLVDLCGLIENYPAARECSQPVILNRY